VGWEGNASRDDHSKIDAHSAMGGNLQCWLEQSWLETRQLTYARNMLSSFQQLAQQCGSDIHAKFQCKVDTYIYMCEQNTDSRTAISLSASKIVFGALPIRASQVLLSSTV
jgi:hypothetical protein